MSNNYIAYYRVSTKKQGESKLGLEAQEQAVQAFIQANGGTLMQALTEVESGKRHQNRPQLEEAMRLCRIHRATLLVAKLDRLSRDAAFLMKLQNDGTRFKACDMPHADSFTVGILALIAQKEREFISERTKAALAIKKAQGVKLGGVRSKHGGTTKTALKASNANVDAATVRASDYRDDVAKAREAGCTSVRSITAHLNERKVPAVRGGEWHPSGVSRLLRLLAA